MVILGSVSPTPGASVGDTNCQYFPNPHGHSKSLRHIYEYPNRDSDPDPNPYPHAAISSNNPARSYRRYFY